MNPMQLFVTPYSLAGSVSDTADFVARKPVDDSEPRALPDAEARQSASLDGGKQQAFFLSDVVIRLHE